MKKNRVKELWREGKVAVGTWMVLGSPLVAEILANLGFDWLVIDTEHGAIDIGTTASIIQAIRTTDTVPMVRVPWNDPALGGGDSGGAGDQVSAPGHQELRRPARTTLWRRRLLCPCQ
jgi:4-hydroxy-2-oxoheptanedioate aldolase